MILFAGCLSSAGARADGRRSKRGDATPDPAALEARARAERLELGGHVAANVLLYGVPRPEWIEAAGGNAPPADLLWPLEGGQVARGFGSGWRGRHRALDLMAAHGTIIRAAAAGLVAYSAWGVRGYGGLVMIVHPGGWVTLYAHASELLTRPGRIVQRGQTIAKVGRTGNANGDHLHFELRRAGERADPAALFVEVPAGVVVPRAPAELNERSFLWRVRRGQDLSFIARHAAVTVERIRALNDLPADGHLTPGMRIVVPRNTPDGAPPRFR